MKIVEPSFEIVNPVDREEGIAMLRKIEGYARISHASEERQTEDTWERFIKGVVIDHADWSVTEHQIVTVIARVDRGVSHEWVRDRIGSYTQESTRFVNYKKVGQIDVIIIFHEPINEVSGRPGKFVHEVIYRTLWPNNVYLSTDLWVFEKEF